MQEINFCHLVSLILENEEWLNIGSACKLFGVNRSGYYTS